MKKELYEMLLSSAESDKKKALLSLELLSNTSTEDVGDTASEAMRLLTDADGRINTLGKYFKNKSKRQLNG
tara:strand:- start:15 stop:227 length:213 start_codon:yes stop_codon:yes gene_type:complete